MHYARKAWTQADSSTPYWNETEPKKNCSLCKKKKSTNELQCVTSESKWCHSSKTKSFGVAENFCG